MTNSAFASAPRVRARSFVLKAAVVGAVAFAIGVPIAQGLMSFGLSPAAFASDGNQTLRAAPYAFSIWGVIYAALVAYGAYQAWPRTPNSALMGAVGWPAVVAIAACGLWILASAFDQRIATVIIIMLAAVTLARTVLPATTLAFSIRERIVVLWPLQLLAGWLTVASAINLLLVLTGYGVITEGSAPLAAGLGVLVLLGVGVWGVVRFSALAFAVPIAWGLAAVYVAEYAHRPFVALIAAAGALLIVFAGVALIVRLSAPSPSLSSNGRVLLFPRDLK
jgi:hypothetical protein